MPTRKCDSFVLHSRNCKNMSIADTLASLAPFSKYSVMSSTFSMSYTNTSSSSPCFLLSDMVCFTY